MKYRLSKLYITTCLFCSLLFFNSVCKAEEVYKSVDKKGDTVFSDEYVNGAESITVDDTEDANAPPTVNKTYPQTGSKPKDKTSAYEIKITSPKKDDFFTTDKEDIQVTTKLNQKLKDGDLFYLYLNGDQYGEGQESPDFTIKRLDRGQYTLKVTVEKTIPSVNKNVKATHTVLTTSKEISFTQYRADIHNFAH